MDMNNWKKLLGAGLVSAAALNSPSAFAAQADITVDVNLPTVLVMYHYNTIELDLDQAALAGFLVGAGPAACAGDFCDDQGNPAAIAVGVIGATNDIPQAVVAPALANTSATFTLQDSVGVRALGCTSYDVTVVDDSVDAGVTVDAAGSLTDIDTQPCSLGITTGDLVFDVDFTTLPAGATTVSAVFDVTITGI